MTVYTNTFFALSSLRLTDHTLTSLINPTIEPTNGNAASKEFLQAIGFVRSQSQEISQMPSSSLGNIMWTFLGNPLIL
ncbi:hypothetical protein CP08DC60_0126 [Chlamydia psittaci 08DC60]|nr:hypothetical protein CP08DC60_0126 [Chlamydia psittaci 08DC60]